MKKLFLSLFLIGTAGAAFSVTQGAGQTDIQFVFTSDAHYGITRRAFRGAVHVDAHMVNAAMVATMNTLASHRFPYDRGLKAGELIGPMDFLAEGGDIANRSEADDAQTIQSAAASWAQFRKDYLERLVLWNRAGERAPVFVVPGNHDASNAVGYYLPMKPLIDKTAMVEIYNLMIAPAIRKTTATYSFATDRVLTSRDIGGVHFVFLTVWPDSIGRAWLERDLRRIGTSTPVVVFAHDQPEAQSKHFTNPNGHHDINSVDRFENLLADTFADGPTIQADDRIEQGDWETFVKRHPNITAYFHGNSNWNEFYDWTGPHHTVALHTFRVDSPMKGKMSEEDETKLSFQVATINAATKTMTVRECFWNADPNTIVWGASATVTLR